MCWMKTATRERSRDCYTNAVPERSDYIHRDELRRLIELAKHEDLGPDRVDITSNCTIPPDLVGSANFVARQPGIISGLAILPHVCEAYSEDVTALVMREDGDSIGPGDTLASLAGPMRDLLGIERVALNIMTHLSGIATLTAEYAKHCEGTKAKVYDTRKTLPGLRGLQKYAVACGGGGTHRIGLYDAVLIKDNHLAGIALDQLATRLAEACTLARADHPNLKFVEVEVDTLEQLVEVLKAPIDIVLLDNMAPPELAAAVKLRDTIAPNVELEASGGITLDTIHSIAKTNVDRISVGALTHSAPSLDIGLDIG